MFMVKGSKVSRPTFGKSRQGMRMGNTFAHALSHLLLENLDVLEALDLPACLAY